MDAHGGPRTAARVLAVDDEPDVLSSLSDILTGLSGLEVDRASSLATALVLIREHPYDIVIADERLSDGSGVELLRWVGHLQPAAGRVLASAHDDFASLVKAVNEAHIHLYVPKPWDPEGLVHSVHRLVLEQAVMQERLRAFARATGPEHVPEPAPTAAGPWPPS